MIFRFFVKNSKGVKRQLRAMVGFNAAKGRTCDQRQIEVVHPLSCFFQGACCNAAG